MLKKLVILFFALSINANSQDWTKALSFEFIHNGFGYSTNDNAKSLTTDSQGNLYVTGSFEGKLIIGTDSLLSNGSVDIFVAKYLADGTPVWAVSAGGASADYGLSIEIDALNNIYITGYYYDSAAFGGIQITAYKSSDIYAAKLSSDGYWLWAKSYGGNGYDKGQKLALDADANIYLTGVIEQTAYFDEDSLTSEGSRDIFVAKIDSAGNKSWQVKAGGSSADDAFGIETDNDGNSYVTGYFQTTASFGSTNLTSTGSRDIYVAKINSSGVWNWAVKAGGTGADIANDITFDSDGNLFVIGSFEGNLTLAGNQYASAGKKDIIIAKINTAGTWLAATKAGGTANDQGNSITSKGDGLAIVGNFQGVAEINSVNYYSQGSLDIFYADLSSDLAWSNVKTAGGTAYDDVNDIIADSQSNTLTCGYSYGNSSFGSINLIGVGNSDGFIIRQYPSSAWVWAKSIAGLLDYSEIMDIFSDSKYNKFIIGTYYGTIKLGNQSVTSAGGSDIFVAKLDSSDNCLWLKSAGGTTNDFGNAIVTDTLGNIYIAGGFSESSAFGNINVNAKGLTDAFVARISPVGDFIWAKNAGGYIDDRATGISADFSGNIYVSGSYYDKCYFGSTSVEAEGYDDAFLAKIDSTGAWLWIKSVGGDDFDASKGVKTDSAGNAYLYGTFVNQVTIGGTTLSSRGSEDAFLAKISPSGSWQWAIQAGGTSLNDAFNDVYIKSSDEIYVCGSFSNVAYFDTLLLATRGEVDGFIAKLNSLGKWQWIKDFGNTGNDAATALTFDKDNRLYLTGVFSETVNIFGETVSSSGMQDVFLAQLDDSGELSWITKAGGNYSDAPNAIASPSSGVSYVAGSYFGSISFDINSLFNLSYLDKNSFYAKNEYRPLPDWDFTEQTGRSATIIIPDSIIPQFNGNNVSYGDAIGLFYTDYGTLKCAGYQIWESPGMEITVWGNDYNTPAKDGFNSGENYTFKIWDSETDEEYIVNARFSSGPRSFTLNSTSVVETMPAIWDTLTIPISVGWNSISSYCMPEYALMDSVFSKYFNQVLIVKNGKGKIFVPQYDINTIGDLNIKDGYNLYSIANFDLKIAGIFVNPEEETISLTSGWNFISYTRQTAMPIATAYAPIVSKLLIAKNGKGKLYVPQYNINTILNLMPGEGYQLYLTQPANLTYPAND